MQGFGKSLEDDCKTLLGLLIEAAESLKGRRAPDQRLVDSQPLAGKVVCHAFSILYLFRGTRLDDIPPAPIDFVDHASIHVLTRALLESVWAFHHVFVEPNTEDDFTFRYSSWMIAGLIPRQHYPALTGSGRRQLDDDRQAIESYRTALRGTRAFAELSKDKQREALNGKQWRPASFRATATAFLGKRFGATVYSWLSSYQHADGLSAIQIRDAKTHQDRRDMAESLLALVAVSLSQMIRAYVRLWPELEEVISRYPDIGTLVEMYTRFPYYEPDVD